MGITEKAAQVLPMGAEMATHLLVNYFFTASASLLLALVGGLLITKVLEPRLPQPTGDGSAPEGEAEHSGEVTPLQMRALLAAGAAVALYAAIVLTVWLMPGSPLRGEGGALVPSPC